MFDYFRNCSSIANQVCCEDSPTKGPDNLFSVWWPCSSIKVTTVSETWQMFNLYYNTNSHVSDSILSNGMTVCHIIIYVWHICSCSFHWPWGKVIVNKVCHLVLQAARCIFEWIVVQNWISSKFFIFFIIVYGCTLLAGEVSFIFMFLPM